MKKIIEFTFEGFQIQATFSKDTEPPYDSWELDNWRFSNADNIFKLASILHTSVPDVNERVEASCYEALENHDDEDDKFDEK